MLYELFAIVNETAKRNVIKVQMLPAVMICNTQQHMIHAHIDWFERINGFMAEKWGVLVWDSAIAHNSPGIPGTLVRK